MKTARTLLKYPKQTKKASRDARSYAVRAGSKLTSWRKNNKSNAHTIGNTCGGHKLFRLGDRCTFEREGKKRQKLANGGIKKRAANEKAIVSATRFDKNTLLCDHSSKIKILRQNFCVETLISLFSRGSFFGEKCKSVCVNGCN